MRPRSAAVLLAAVLAACGGRPSDAESIAIEPDVGREGEPPPQGHEWLVWSDGSTGATSHWVRKADDGFEILATRSGIAVAEGEHLYVVKTADGLALHDLLGPKVLVVAPPGDAMTRIEGSGNGKLGVATGGGFIVFDVDTGKASPATPWRVEARDGELVLGDTGGAIDEVPGIVSRLVAGGSIAGTVGWSRLTFHDTARQRALDAFRAVP